MVIPSGLEEIVIDHRHTVGILLALNFHLALVELIRSLATAIHDTTPFLCSALSPAPPKPTT